MKSKVFWISVLISIFLIACNALGQESIVTNTDSTTNKDNNQTSPPLSLKVKELSFFTKATTTQNYPGKVGEYEVLDEGARAGIGFAAGGENDKSYIDVQGDFQNDAEQSYHALWDIGKAFKGVFDFDKLRHWLDHDPIKNVNEVKGLPPTRKVYTKDLDAGTDYKADRSVAHASFSYQSPDAPEITGHVSFRQEERRGSVQAISFTMCQTCHVSSRAKQIDQVTQTYSAGVTFQKGKVTADYTFGYRKFEEKAPAPTNFYEGPSTNPDPAFFDTTWPGAPQSYSDKRTYSDEELPYSFVPNSEKTSHTLKTTVRLPHRSNLTVVGDYSANQNLHNSAWLKYNSVASLFNSAVTDKLSLNLKYRYQHIDNDDIESAQVAALAPYLLPNDPYFSPTRLYNSALSRETHKANVDLVYRLLRRSVLRLGWEGDIVDRKNYEGGKTTKNSFRTSVSTRISRKFNTKLEYIGSWIDNPFENYRGGKEVVADSFYLGDIYSTFLDSLRSPLSSDPTREDRGRVRLGFSPSEKWDFSLDTEYRHSRNQTTGWKADYLTPGVSMNFLPSEKTNMNLTYSYQYGRTKTIFSVPVMLLKAGQLNYHYGSINVLIPYNEDIHSLGLGIFRQLSPKLSWNSSATYLFSQGEYITKDLKGHPIDHPEEELDLTDFDTYGKHDYRQLYITLNLDYRLLANIYLTGELGYYDFSNKKIYIYDIDGSVYVANIGISFKQF